VRIVLAQFKGLGLYRTLPQAATDAGPAQVSVIVGVGIHGRRPFLGRASVVTATSSTPTTLGGRFHATILGPKQTPFRATEPGDAPSASARPRSLAGRAPDLAGVRAPTAPSAAAVKRIVVLAAAVLLAPPAFTVSGCRERSG
jgi:hypothetical protein